MLTIVGNGPSRKDIDLNSLDRCYGCNAVHRDATPELLFAVDIPMQAAILQTDYHKNNRVVFPGWEPLEIRRKNRKLQLLYNIKNGSAPNYLCELLPPTIQSTTNIL